MLRGGRGATNQTKLQKFEKSLISNYVQRFLLNHLSLISYFIFVLISTNKGKTINSWGAAGRGTSHKIVFFFLFNIVGACSREGRCNTPKVVRCKANQTALCLNTVPILNVDIVLRKRTRQKAAREV